MNDRFARQPSLRGADRLPEGAAALALGAVPSGQTGRRRELLVVGLVSAAALLAGYAIGSGGSAAAAEPAPAHAASATAASTPLFARFRTQEHRLQPVDARWTAAATITPPVSSGGVFSDSRDTAFERTRG
jgi:hypothetical protein